LNRHFCTYLDHSYVPRFLMLHESLVRSSHSFHLWALCFDDRTYEMLHNFRLEHVQLIKMRDFEVHNAVVAATKSSRSRAEYYFTCTPALPLYVLDTCADVDLVTYIDADFLFFAEPDAICRELGSGSVGIVEHRFPPALSHLEAYGKHNVGVLSFRNDERAKECLRWWRDRCVEWCFDRLEDGKFADQKYLDSWPDRFPGVVVIDHKGVNLAPWNVSQYIISRRNGAVFVDDAPLICYHFQGLKKVNAYMYDSNLHTYGAIPSSSVIRNIYAPYIRGMERIGRENWPSQYHSASGGRHRQRDFVTRSYDLFTVVRHGDARCSKFSANPRS
jgi:hypothetical protein